MTEEDIKKLQSTGGEHLSATEKNILGNDLDKITDKVASMKGGRIDFVLDNAGFELYCDLVYADWLIQSGICKEIVFHGKKVGSSLASCYSKETLTSNCMAPPCRSPGSSRTSPRRTGTGS